MTNSPPNQRLYAGLLALGACILICRTSTMVIQGSLSILVPWVSGLLIAEFLIDLGCLLACIHWWIKNEHKHSYLPLRLGTAAALLHAIRVLIFVLGRTERFHNFDVRPEMYEQHMGTWGWSGVYFAAVMALLGVCGVLVIWRIRRKSIEKSINTTSKS
jgi:hypothetical protein